MMSSNDSNNITVESLSYKELQGLAMSLNLPGKMKQGVLVEAIKARQNHNEQAVTMILEANRQRRIVKRQHQLQMQQQQLLKINSEKMIKSSATRHRMKRSASEMEMSSFIDEEGFKRSKLAAALIHQQQRRPAFFSSLTTTSRQQPATWPTDPMIETAIIQKPLPDLSTKELSILPSADSSCSAGSSSCWSATESLPQSSFESCDPTWIEDCSYDLNSWNKNPGGFFTEDLFADDQDFLNNADYQQQVDQNTTWCGEQQQQQQQTMSTCNESYFRIQRPGNPTAFFVPSGRSLTLPTFCNMLPRVASYVQ